MIECQEQNGRLQNSFAVQQRQQQWQQQEQGQWQQSLQKIEIPPCVSIEEWNKLTGHYETCIEENQNYRNLTTRFLNGELQNVENDFGGKLSQGKDFLKYFLKIIRFRMQLSEYMHQFKRKERLQYLFECMQNRVS